MKMANKSRETLGDYVSIAISPILIMALVGSLVFFLLEILYVGKYGARLQWILFCFVFAIVLIARMSMRDDLSAPWGLYGLILGIVVFVALLRFVEYDEDVPLAPFGWLINIGLMAIVWWCAHKLTWDCTYIDDKVDASGVGVLQAAGLEEGKTEDRGSKIEDRESEEVRTSPERQRRVLRPSLALQAGKARGDSSDPQSSILNPRSSKPKSKQTGFMAWWERYEKYREEQRRKPHTPGVWVIYFSLAALPIFGLGQALIPAEAEARRRYVFWLMIIYVGSGLGLLLTTCFLGLRRYLRQRRLPMPTSVAGVWLTTGGLLIAALLVGGAVLPRPNAEYPLVDVGKLVGSQDRQASRYATKGDSPGKGEGKSATGKAPEDEKGNSGSGNKKDQQGGNQTQGKSGQGKDNSKSADKGAKSGDKQGKSSQSGQKAQGKSDQDKDKKDKSAKSSGSSSGDDKQASVPKTPQSFHAPLTGWFASVLKWVVFAVLALAVAFYLLRNGLKRWANFSQWARRLLAALDAFWQKLFGWWQPRRGDAEKTLAREPAPTPPRPFSSYDNPFRDGSSGWQSPEELVRLTFEAFEAWAREHDLPRQSGETPLEFTHRVGQEVPPLELETKELGSLYVRAAYAEVRLPESSRDSLRQFWERLETVEEAPLSA
jgi:hypothetical protein